MRTSKEPARGKNSETVSTATAGTIHFGAFVKVLRHRQGIRQSQVLAHLPGWTQTTYSRVETSELAPAFDQLAAIYTALCQAGVAFTPQDRQQFLTLARLRIESKRTYLERKSDQEWDELRLRLSWTPHDTKEPIRQRQYTSRPRLVETRHLIGREDWLASVIASLQGHMPKKLVVLQGPVGIGKSSELHRIALHFLSSAENHPYVVLCDIPAVEGEAGPESTLDLFLGTVLAEFGPADSSIQSASLATRSQFVLECLEKAARPLLLLIDNAEQLLDTHGRLAPCWEQFLRAFLRSQHRASLVLATREWPGWFEGERVFLAERIVPALSADDGAILLQRLGLAAVPITSLRQATETVSGVPLCLEWMASLVQEPLWLDTWEGGNDLYEEAEIGDGEELMTRRLVCLLDDASLFSGPIASKLTPLLNRILEKRLSPEAVQVLRVLAFSIIPLGKPALQVICPRPHLIKELGTVSLLATYPHRVQVLPMVAAQIRSQLSSEERYHCEDQLIKAYAYWLDQGSVGMKEAGAIVTALAVLYLMHHQLLDAAQLLIQYGWLSFNMGNAPRLARLVLEITEHIDETASSDNQYGSTLLCYYLYPFLGKTFDTEERRSDYLSLQQAILADEITLQPLTEIHVTHHLLLAALNGLRFEEALTHLNTCLQRLVAVHISHLEVQVSLLEEQALVYGRWSEYAEEQGDNQSTKTYREATIRFYRQCCQLLQDAIHGTIAPLQESSFKKRLALSLNNLCYQLHRDGQYKEALDTVNHCIALKEHGYTQYGALASAYGEKSQILASLGFFQEALIYDDMAITAVQNLAAMGHRPSQEEVWIYRVNRGKLYLRSGKVDEAEQLLQEALPHIHLRRRVYRMFAQDGLHEIEQWRQQTSASHYQLDWRWIGRYRELDSYDAYWWWAQAGPFTEEEQRLWQQFYRPDTDPATKGQLNSLIVASRQRELDAALTERREPHLRYPALAIDEVHMRIAAMQQLDTEIEQQEPHAIVRRLYHGAIEEEIHFLQLIEATYEGNSERFQEISKSLNPPPTVEEMNIALEGVRQVLLQGLRRPELTEESQHLLYLLQGQLHLSLDISVSTIATRAITQLDTPSSRQPVRKIPANEAQRLFVSLLQEAGFAGWNVEIDPKASSPRVEIGLQRLFLPETPLSFERIQHYISHELAGHVARAVNGEHSLLGLLGMNTKDYMVTEEGLALFQERQALLAQGQVFDDSVAWMGTLAVGLASGVVTPPQTFLSLFYFFEAFHLLSRLVEDLDDDVQTAQEKARKAAFATCLRTFRGVPDLTQVGVCYTKDVVYLRGLRLIEAAAAKDASILDKLAVGKVALALLADVQELGIHVPAKSLGSFVVDPALATHLRTFEEQLVDVPKDA